MNTINHATTLSILFTLWSSASFAATISLSFAGAVDRSGATLGGVDAAIDSPFTLCIGIDDSAAATGRYAIDSIGYTLTLGTYTTLTDWSTELVATQEGESIRLTSDPKLSRPGEHFYIDLDGFVPSRFDDPSTWTGPSLLSGDFVVRGIGGDESPDQLSGTFIYQGTLVLTVVPESSSLLAMSLGILWCFGACRQGMRNIHNERRAAR